MFRCSACTADSVRNGHPLCLLSFHLWLLCTPPRCRRRPSNPWSFDPCRPPVVSAVRYSPYNGDAGVPSPFLPLQAAATCELLLLYSLRLARLVPRCGVCGLDKYYALTFLIICYQQSACAYSRCCKILPICQSSITDTNDRSVFSRFVTEHSRFLSFGLQSASLTLCCCLTPMKWMHWAISVDLMEIYIYIYIYIYQNDTLLIKKVKLMNLFKQIWSIYSQSAATLNDMYGCILQTLFHKNVAAQKHWYHLACRKTSLVSLNMQS